MWMHRRGVEDQLRAFVDVELHLEGGVFHTLAEWCSTSKRNGESAQWFATGEDQGLGEAER